MSIKKILSSTWTGYIFYGWWLVLLTLMINAITTAPIFAGIGVWVDSLEQQFGWTRTQLSLAFSLGQLEGGVLGPIVGILVDRIGSKKVVFFGILIIGCGFIVLSQTHTISMFYLSYIILMLGVSGAGYLPMMTVINNWFYKKRTVAMGIGGMGYSIGGFLLVPTLAWMVNPSHLGWQTTSMSLGIFFLAAAYPVTHGIKNSPEAYGEIPDGREKATVQGHRNYQQAFHPADIDYSILDVLKMRVFWIISICHGMNSMLISTMTVHLILALKDQGLSLQTAAWIWGLTMGFSGPTQILGGFIGDRAPKKLGLCVFGCIQAVGVILAVHMQSTYLFSLFIIVYGLGFGARIPLGTAIRGEYFGRKAFGRVLGLSMIPMFILMMVGPLAAAWFYDKTGSYDVAFYTLAGVGFAGSVGFLFAKRPYVYEQSPLKSS